MIMNKRFYIRSLCLIFCLAAAVACLCSCEGEGKPAADNIAGTWLGSQWDGIDYEQQPETSSSDCVRLVLDEKGGYSRKSGDATESGTYSYGGGKLAMSAENGGTSSVCAAAADGGVLVTGAAELTAETGLVLTRAGEGDGDSVYGDWLYNGTPVLSIKQEGRLSLVIDALQCTREEFDACFADLGQEERDSIFQNPSVSRMLIAINYFRYTAEQLDGLPYDVRILSADGEGEYLVQMMLSIGCTDAGNAIIPEKKYAVMAGGAGLCFFYKAEGSSLTIWDAGEVFVKAE